MLQNPCKTLGFKTSIVYKIPLGGGGGEVNHIQPVAYYQHSEIAPNHILFFLQAKFLTLKKIRMLIIISILSHKFIYKSILAVRLVTHIILIILGSGTRMLAENCTNRQESYTDSIEWYIGSAVVECSTRERGVVGSKS